jgi:hypothetical protein
MVNTWNYLTAYMLVSTRDPLCGTFVVEYANTTYNSSSPFL